MISIADLLLLWHADSDEQAIDSEQTEINW